MDVLKKVPIREQDPKVRATNFEEVCLGYNKEEAMEEASRCLNCKNAQCVKGCPVSISGMMVSSAKADSEGNGISIRHPLLKRIREGDLLKEDCTLAKIFE